MARKRRKSTRKPFIRLPTRDFERHITRLAKSRKKAYEEAIRVVTLELSKLVMIAWPVDTGRSRAAWGVALEKEGYSTPAYTASQSNAGPSAEEERKGREEGDYQEKRSSKGFTVRLVNGVEYSPWLERGRSRQAPRGVVKESMKKIVKTLREEFKSKSVKDKV